MNNFSTIHVFAYGETQMIGTDMNFKVQTTDLSNATAFIDSIKSKRPADLEETDYHSINVFEGIRVDFNSKERKKNFSVKWKDVDATLLDALVTEISALAPVKA